MRPAVVPPGAMHAREHPRRDTSEQCRNTGRAEKARRADTSRCRSLYDLYHSYTCRFRYESARSRKRRNNVRSVAVGTRTNPPPGIWGRKTGALPKQSASRATKVSNGGGSDGNNSCDPLFRGRFHATCPVRAVYEPPQEEGYRLYQ